MEGGGGGEGVDPLRPLSGRGRGVGAALLEEDLLFDWVGRCMWKDYEYREAVTHASGRCTQPTIALVSEGIV